VSSISSPVTSSSAHRLWSRALVSSELFFICAIVLLSALLCPLAMVGGPTWRFKLFEIISVVFFALTLLRSLLRSNHAVDVGPDPVAPESKASVGLLAALVAGALAYASTVPLYFTCDDFEHLSLVRRPFMTAVWPQVTEGQFDGLAHIFYRPLGFASLFADYQLWHNWAPGYHLTNILLHLLCIAGVFFFCKQLELGDETCVAAAMIFAVLPVNVQAITWIGCRFDQLATALGMWSLTFAARFRRTGHNASYGMALLLFVLAVLSKESAYVVPVLWLALELMPREGSTLRPPFTKRSEPLLGYIAVPLVMFYHRLHTLGGVGGYRLGTDGSPVAQSLGMQSLIGLLVRAPGEALFGYNWLQSHDRGLAVAAGVTAAMFLALCLFAKPNFVCRRIIGFCLIWVFAAALPAHFYFLSPDPGLFYSRALHFGSIGIAILIAVLLGQTVRNPRMCLGCSVAACLLLFVGVEHNIRAWRYASQESLRVQAVLGQLQPSPPRHAVFYIEGVPDIINGVPFFTVGLGNAVRFHYSWRDDIHVRTRNSRYIESSAIPLDMTPRRR